MMRDDSDADKPAMTVEIAAPRRKLWLCADDYGISPAVSRAIRDLIGRGRLNATSVMVTAPGFSAAEAQALAGLAETDCRAAIGLHFTLTAPFRPAFPAYRPAAPDGAFFSLARTFAMGLSRRLDPLALTAEAEGQFAAFQAAFGRPPDFVDGHQHVQLLPQVSDAVLAVMKRYVSLLRTGHVPVEELVIEKRLSEYTNLVPQAIAAQHLVKEGK